MTARMIVFINLSVVFSCLLIYVYRWLRLGVLRYSQMQAKGYKCKNINVAAKERLPLSILASIHNVELPRQKAEDKNRGSGLIVDNYLGRRKISHKLAGYIHKDFNTVLMNFGGGFSSE